MAEPAEVLAAERVVIPGVGAFRDAIARLRERGPGAGAARRRGSGRPVLGVCLGMQLLATRSSEFGTHEGLDLIPGSVELMRDRPRRCGSRTSAGTTSTAPARRPLLGALGPEPTFYYVHSYEFLPEDPAAVTGVTDYGRPVTACVGVGQRVRRAVPSREERAGRPRAAERLRRVLKTRLIPCLLLQNGLLVRSEEFRTHQVIGQPDPPGRALQRMGGRRADLPRHHPRGRARPAPRRPQGQGRADMLEIVEEISRTCFVPLTFGGGIRTSRTSGSGSPAAPTRSTINTRAVEEPGVHHRGGRRASAARRSSSRSTRERAPTAAGR